MLLCLQYTHIGVIKTPYVTHDFDLEICRHDLQSLHYVKSPAATQLDVLSVSYYPSPEGMLNFLINHSSNAYFCLCRPVPIATLTGPSTGITMTVSSNAPGFEWYTGWYTSYQRSGHEIPCT